MYTIILQLSALTLVAFLSTTCATAQPDLPTPTPYPVNTPPRVRPTPTSMDALTRLIEEVRATDEAEQGSAYPTPRQRPTLTYSPTRQAFQLNRQMGQTTPPVSTYTSTPSSTDVPDPTQAPMRRTARENNSTAARACTMFTELVDDSRLSMVEKDQHLSINGVSQRIASIRQVLAQDNKQDRMDMAMSQLARITWNSQNISGEDKWQTGIIYGRQMHRLCIYGNLDRAGVTADVIIENVCGGHAVYFSDEDINPAQRGSGIC